MGVKKTGQARQFDTGAQRDSAEGKPRMSLVPHKALKSVMMRYLDGAEAYGEANWHNGMNHSVLYDSAMRHLMADFTGDDSEDHLGAALWNIMCMIEFRETRPDLDDREKYC